jgi:hypothetical protein
MYGRCFLRRLLVVPVLAGLMLPLALSQAGCDAPAVDRQAYVAVPPDFSLDVVVIGVDRTPAWEELTPEERQRVPRPLLSARFIVQPDGTLRTATGAGAREETYPAIVRTLSRAQMLDLWRAVRNHGLIAAEDTHGLPNPDKAEPIDGSALYAIGFVALADRVAVGVPAEEASREGEGARTLITLLRAYSWLEI